MNGKRLKEIRKAKNMTLDELASRVGTSKQTVSRYESGVISNIPHERVAALAEALEVPPSALMGWEDGSGEEGREARRVIPLLGQIACGEPIFAEEEHEGYIASDGSFPADFCLRARGDSMVGARIFDGDLVFIKGQDTVENGEIAAVIINDEATLKRVYFYPEEGKLILSPENPKYPPLVYVGGELNQIKILGKAVAFQSVIF